MKILSILKTTLFVKEVFKTFDENHDPYEVAITPPLNSSRNAETPPLPVKSRRDG